MKFILKWIWRLFLLAFFGFFVLAGVQAYQKGYFSLPDLPDDAYAISFSNGLRGILYDAEVSDKTYKDAPKYFRRLALANPDRKYLGLPMDVAPWFEDVWSSCRSHIDGAQEYFEQDMPTDLLRQLQGAKFEAICLIEIEDQKDIVRGALYSVPKM
nr:hypothetical protein [uncultured Celeribacter sp.]